MNKRSFTAAATMSTLVISSYLAIPSAHASTPEAATMTNKSNALHIASIAGNHDSLSAGNKSVSGTCVAQASRVVTATLGAMTGSVGGPISLVYGWMKFVNVVVAEPKSKNGAYFVC
jgi:hypothetical protein